MIYNLQKLKNVPLTTYRNLNVKHFLIYKKRNDIIVTRADKGGAVVILGIKDYIDDDNRQRH